MSRTIYIEKAYNFFVDAEKKALVFSLQDVASATGWSIQTVKAYKTKKWDEFLKETQSGFVCEGVAALSIDAFIRVHAQKITLEDNLLRPKHSPKIDALIDKSRESALLAVQIFNNPMMQFRTPGFIVNMVIAYTALLHAVFERDGIDYRYKKPDGTYQVIDKDFKYWELSMCLKKYYGGKQTPETENLRLFIQLRNKIEHRFVPALDFAISGYCQSLLLNFERVLVDEFSQYFALGQSGLALALQISEYTSQRQEALRRIQTNHLDSISSFITEYGESLPDEILTSSDFCFRAFLVPKLGNHAKTSDKVIEFIKFDVNNPEEMEQYEKQVAFIKEKQVLVPHNIRAHNIVEIFLAQDKLAYPSVYIQAALTENRIYLPIYYFASLSKKKEFSLAEVIDSVPNIGLHKKKIFVQRLKDDADRKKYYQWPKTDQAKKIRSDIIERILDKSLRRKLYDAKNLFQAIQLLEKNQIDKDYVLDLLSELYAEYSTDQYLNTDLYKAICRIDYCLFGFDIV